jgi:regulator of replication initiation timing
MIMLDTWQAGDAIKALLNTVRYMTDECRELKENIANLEHEIFLNKLEIKSLKDRLPKRGRGRPRKVKP